MTRNERQEVAVNKWLEKKNGTIVAVTGFGKTKMAVDIINKLGLDTIVIVPSRYLKEQWEAKVNAKVYVVNTAVKMDLSCELLVLDEYHSYAAEERQLVFNIKHNHILGLTATLERLDGKHDMLEEKAPVVDTITIKECRENGYIATFAQYVVYLDVDLKEYNKLSKTFNKLFAAFDHDFRIMQQCSKDATNYAKRLRADPKQLRWDAIRCMRTLQVMTQFCYNHPAKVEAAKKILAEKQAKAIVFSMTQHVASQIDVAYHTGIGSKRRAEIMAEFIAAEKGTLSTAKAVDVGADIPGVSLGIILAGTSSPTQFVQRRGRVIRKEGDKYAELYYIVLRGTKDEAWFRKAVGKEKFVAYGDR